MGLRNGTQSLLPLPGRATSALVLFRVFRIHEQASVKSKSGTWRVRPCIHSARPLAGAPHDGFRAGLNDGDGITERMPM